MVPIEDLSGKDEGTKPKKSEFPIISGKVSHFPVIYVLPQLVAIHMPLPKYEFYYTLI